MYDIIFSRIIDSDIDQCYTAENMFTELYEKINDILKNPYKRPLVQDKYLASLGIRAIKVKNYVLYYSITEEKNTVNALRFMHQMRDWINILKENPLGDIHDN